MNKKIIAIIIIVLVIIAGFFILKTIFTGSSTGPSLVNEDVRNQVNSNQENVESLNTTDDIFTEIDSSLDALG